MGGSGDLDVTVTDASGLSCRIHHLDNGDNNFNKCDIDTFREEELEECNKFPIPAYVISRLRVTHDGIDGWKGDYFK